MTAVEWMVKQLNINGKVIPMEIESKAKEMEREQITDARQSGIDATINGKSISNIDYYNETFKSE